MNEPPNRLLRSTDAEVLAFLTCYARLCRRVEGTGRRWPMWYPADLKDGEVMRDLTRRAEAAHRYHAKTAMRSLLAASPDLNATCLAEHAADVLDRPDWLDDPEHWVWDLAADVAEGELREL